MPPPVPHGMMGPPPPIGMPPNPPDMQAAAEVSNDLCMYVWSHYSKYRLLHVITLQLHRKERWMWPGYLVLTLIRPITSIKVTKWHGICFKYHSQQSNISLPSCLSASQSDNLSSKAGNGLLFIRIILSLLNCDVSLWFQRHTKSAIKKQPARSLTACPSAHGTKT